VFIFTILIGSGSAEAALLEDAAEELDVLLDAAEELDWLLLTALLAPEPAQPTRTVRSRLMMSRIGIAFQSLECVLFIISSPFKFLMRLRDAPAFM